jgi:hypothetical protein
LIACFVEPVAPPSSALAKEYRAGMEASIKEQNEKTIGELKQEWGKDYDNRMEDARTFLVMGTNVKTVIIRGFRTTQLIVKVIHLIGITTVGCFKITALCLQVVVSFHNIVYNKVFSTDEGKIVLASIMSICGVDTISADLQNPNITYYNEGARAVGLKIKMIINEKEKKDV